jgi:hypothetical protein
MKENSKAASEPMARVHFAAALPKRWLLGTRQGTLSLVSL